MSAARLPLAYRDSCAHLLIPLNRCRFDTYYLPWKCMVRPSPRFLHDPWCRPGATGEGAHKANQPTNRTSVIATRSASTSSSNAGSKRWTSCERRETAKGAIDIEGRADGRTLVVCRYEVTGRWLGRIDETITKMIPSRVVCVIKQRPWLHLIIRRTFSGPSDTNPVERTPRGQG